MLLQNHSLDEMQDFIRSFQIFSSEMDNARYNGFHTSFKDIHIVLSELTILAKEEYRHTAPDYNIFTILGVEENEVRTHSAFLANLLNPRGSHGQGELFLRLFLKRINLELSYDSFQKLGSEYQWHIETEKSTTFGRLDIVISCRKKGVLIVIENKIYAADQEEQLQRYINWMETVKTKYSPEKMKLIYLTPDGRKSYTAKSEDYIRMSYKKDIISLLQRSQEKVKASNVKEMVHQYIQIIEKL